MSLNSKLNSKTIILGSKSPRRRELIEEMGFRVKVANYEVEEVYDNTLSAKEIAENLAILKSNGYPNILKENEILITADTIVVLNDEILGKPKDREEAVNMIRKMSNREHTVITGVAIRDNKSSDYFTTSTEVLFRELAQEEIEYYVDRYKPYDKAGAYGIQEWIGYVGITSISGSFYNVMGLPTQTLYTKLIKFINKEQHPSIN